MLVTPLDVVMLLKTRKTPKKLMFVVDPVLPDLIN